MKKIMVSLIALVLIGVAGFVGYTAYENNKESNVTEEQSNNESNTTSDEDLLSKDGSSGVDEETLKGMTDSQKEETAAMQVFMNAMQTTQTIKDTNDSNLRAQVQKNIDKYLIGQAKTAVESILKNVNSTELKDLQVITERAETVTLGDGTEQNGYMIYYRVKYLRNGNKEENPTNNKEVDFNSAFVVKDTDEQYKVSYLYIPAVKELPDYCK